MDGDKESDPLGGLSGVLKPAEHMPGKACPCLRLVAHGYLRKTVFACFQGHIGLADSDVFKAALNGLVLDSTDKVILDLKDVQLTATTVGVLVAFAGSMHGRDIELYLYRPSAQSRACLYERNIASLFKIFETEDDVTASLLI
ncbi:MAG: hypothetical protein LBQ51_07070 [Desulfovibrio sp.]|jgi:anti-anti-sigma regulatory factor|nr:hypothetical protein [Desulfovibrio sp.]